MFFKPVSDPRPVAGPTFVPNFAMYSIVVCTMVDMPIKPFQNQNHNSRYNQLCPTTNT